MVVLNHNLCSLALNGETNRDHSRHVSTPSNQIFPATEYFLLDWDNTRKFWFEINVIALTFCHFDSCRFHFDPHVVDVGQVPRDVGTLFNTWVDSLGFTIVTELKRAHLS